MGSFPEGWAPGEHYPEKWSRRFAIDFVGGDFVTREEFDTVKDMLGAARAEIAALKTRVDVMEATGAAASAAPKPVTKKSKG